MSFKPQPDYAGLLKQAQAMHMLIEAQSAELSTLRARDYALREQRLAEMEAQLSSERAANALLTEQNDALTRACERLQAENSELQTRARRFIEMF